MILMTRPALAETNAMKLGNQPGPKALSEQHCGLDSKPLGNPKSPPVWNLNRRPAPAALLS